MSACVAPVWCLSGLSRQSLAEAQFPRRPLLRLSEKGLEWYWNPLTAGLQQRKWGFLDPFRRLLRLRFDADRDFSDSLSRQLGA
jgi:hypothetical protein